MAAIAWPPRDRAVAITFDPGGVWIRLMYGPTLSIRQNAATLDLLVDASTRGEWERRLRLQPGVFADALSELNSGGWPDGFAKGLLSYLHEGAESCGDSERLDSLLLHWDGDAPATVTSWEFRLVSCVPTFREEEIGRGVVEFEMRVAGDFPMTETLDPDLHELLVAADRLDESSVGPGPSEILLAIGEWFGSGAPV